MKVGKILILSIFILQPWFLKGLIRPELLLCVFFVLYSVCLKKNAIPLNELLIIIFSFIILLIPPLVHNTGELGLIKKFISLLVVIIGAYYIVVALKISKQDLMGAIKFCVCFSLVFYLASTQVELLRNVALSFKGETYGIEDKLEVYRLWFPTSAHTFHLGLFFFLTTSLLLVEKESFIYILMSLACASISARSAMLMSICICVLFVLIKDRKYLFMVVVAIPIFYYAMTILANEYVSVKYALEPLEQLIHSGTLQSKSSDELLQKHLYVPAVSSILFGDGMYSNPDGSFYGHSDSGIIRPILYGGIIFQIGYFIFIYRFLSTLKQFYFLGVIVIISFFIANIKAEIITATPYFTLLVLLFYTTKNTNSSVRV